MVSMDKTLVCKECGREFTFTAGEQEFYASRGLTHEPSRCPECRAARKAAGGGRSPSRGGYSSDYGDNYGSSGSSYGGGEYGGSRGGYGERAPRQMYTATCSSCGKEAQVPFQPTSGKPVYCSDCFSQRRSSRY